MTQSPIGIRSLTGVGLSQNPSHAASYRDFSSTRRSCNEYKDVFDLKGELERPPWISENTIQFTSPREYEGRVNAKSLVLPEGNTQSAHLTHHTFSRPKMPPGTLDMGRYTTMMYDPSQDPAVSETQAVAVAVAPYLEILFDACAKYHTHSPQEGWISTTGFVVSASKAGVPLSRSEFLALERAVPKDSSGRINFYHILDLVQQIAMESGQPMDGFKGEQMPEGGSAHETSGEDLNAEVLPQQ